MSATSKLTLVKIGGNVINDEEKLEAFLADFANIEGYKILVHGGGKVASDISKKLGVVPNLIDGRRITDAATLEIVTMVYAGLINKQIVAKLQANGCPAFGLSGADGNLIQAHKRKHPSIDYGFVGDIDQVDEHVVFSLLEEGFVPVVCPLTHDKKGNMLNTNADTIANALAIVMSKKMKVNLYYIFEKTGVLSNPEDDHSLIPQLDQIAYGHYKTNGIISDGMIPKLDNAFLALNQGVEKVVIGSPKLIADLSLPCTVLTLKS